MSMETKDGAQAQVDRVRAEQAAAAQRQPRIPTTRLVTAAAGLPASSISPEIASFVTESQYIADISELTVARQNASAAVLLVATAESDLASVTSLLQRCRELAIQSANDTKSGMDRVVLQAELNMLMQELSRITTSCAFNRKHLLDGSFRDAQFIIGPDRQTIQFSIPNTQPTALGLYVLTTSNPKGIQNATHRQFLGGGFSVGAAGLGAEVGVGVDLGPNSSGYAAETLTVSHYAPMGVVSTQTAVILANQDAKAIAATLSALNGVSASAFNKVMISHVAGEDFNVELTIYGADGAETATLAVIMNRSDALNFATIATTINSSPAMQALNVYAVNNGGISLDIYAANGHNISLKVTGEGSFDAASAFNGHSRRVTSGASYTSAGRVDVTLNAGYSIASNIVGGIFGSTAISAPIATTAVGLTDINGFNAVGGIGATAVDQQLTIAGSIGSAVVTVSAHDAASRIATKINEISATTYVRAVARTTVTLDALSADGTVSFDLYGDNLTAVNITAAVTTYDLTALKVAINNVAGNTGITAVVGAHHGQLILTHQTGHDIKIANFTHRAAVTYQEPSAIPVSTDGSTFPFEHVVTMNVIGNADTNVGPMGDYEGDIVTLKAGGTAGINAQACTVVGGQVRCESSTGPFSMSSSIDGVCYSGSLFGMVANAGNTAIIFTVNEVNISTIAGANSAISVLDGAMEQVLLIRASLRGIHYNLELTLDRLTGNIRDLQAARARLQDPSLRVAASLAREEQPSVVAQEQQAPRASFS